MPRSHLAEIASPEPRPRVGRWRAESALACGLCSLLLIPTISPVSLALAPLAWRLGHVDRRRRRKQGRPADTSADLGRQLGQAVTLLAAVSGALLMVTLSRREFLQLMGWG